MQGIPLFQDVAASMDDTLAYYFLPVTSINTVDLEMMQKLIKRGKKKLLWVIYKILHGTPLFQAVASSIANIFLPKYLTSLCIKTLKNQISPSLF